MSAKKSAMKRPPKVEYKGYLNVNLSADQESEFDAWYAAGSFDFGLLFRMIDFGYKISFSEDEFNDGVAVSMYAKSAKLDWAGWTLTAWAGAWTKQPRSVFTSIGLSLIRIGTNLLVSLKKPTQSADNFTP